MEGEPPVDITKYHAFRKFRKATTTVLQDDGTDLIVHRPKLRSDLIGGEKDIEPFWALMSLRYRSHRRAYIASASYWYPFLP